MNINTVKSQSGHDIHRSLLISHTNKNSLDIEHLDFCFIFSHLVVLNSKILVVNKFHICWLILVKTSSQLRLRNMIYLFV